MIQCSAYDAMMIYLFSLSFNFFFFSVLVFILLFIQFQINRMAAIFSTIASNSDTVKTCKGKMNESMDRSDARFM